MPLSDGFDIPPLIVPMDRDGGGSYDTDELDALVAASKIVLGLDEDDA